MLAGFQVRGRGDIVEGAGCGGGGGAAMSMETGIPVVSAKTIALAPRWGRGWGRGRPGTVGLGVGEGGGGGGGVVRAAAVRNLCGAARVVPMRTAQPADARPAVGFATATVTAAAATAAAAAAGLRRRLSQVAGPHGPAMVGARIRYHQIPSARTAPAGSSQPAATDPLSRA
jgi:hypothetical protein